MTWIGGGGCLCGWGFRFVGAVVHVVVTLQEHQHKLPVFSQELNEHVFNECRINSEVLMSLPVGTITHNTYHSDATVGLGDRLRNGIAIKMFVLVHYH